jgi:serpin B
MAAAPVSNVVMDVNCRQKAALAGALVLFSACVSQAVGQEVSKAQPAMFLKANDSFGFELLRAAHKQLQDHNVVVSPLPVSLSFAALRDGIYDADTDREIHTAFHWDHVAYIPAGARMILARFAKPKPRPPAPKDRPGALWREMQSGKPEELWLSAAFLYRGVDFLSKDFIDKVTYDFGLPFRAVGEHTPQSEVLAKNWDPSLPMPKITKDNDFWITSFTHLRTSWAGNTFAMAKSEKRGFQTRSGAVIQADFLKSEPSTYPYAHTEDFEAVVLTCWQATILLVLPSASSSVEQLEATIASKPDLVESLLERREGDVRLPPFHFSFETNLADAIMQMGAHRIFTFTGALSTMVPSEGGVLRGVAESTEITVDENGIRADAGTIIHGIYGGIVTERDPFHMTLDRPYLFFIRDTVTRALLFEGAVMNPTMH